MSLSPGWTKFWIVYALVGIVAEVVAIIDKQPGDTLSEQIWYLRGVLDANVFSLLMFLLAGGLGWAVYHFAYQRMGE